MPTTRKRRARPMRAIVDAAAVKAFEEQDWSALHRALRLRPWEESPLRVDDGPAPDYCPADRWEKAQALRAALIEAAAHVPARSKL